jgi:hypothetical protein
MTKRTKRQAHHSCTVERRMLVTTTWYKAATGEPTGKVTQQWETKPCAVPLFSDEESARGVCRSCFTGWKVDDNYPTEIGHEQIRNAQHGGAQQ